MIQMPFSLFEAVLPRALTAPDADGWSPTAVEVCILSHWMNSWFMSLRPMLAAIPAAQLARAQADAITVGTKPAALDAEVQKHPILFLHPTAPGGAWFLMSRLPFRCVRDAFGDRR